MYHITTNPEMGRCLYASRTILKGETIAICEILSLSPEDTIKVNETDLKYYTFKLDDSRDCLVLGDGEIFNHDDHANVSYRLVKVLDRQCMVFTASRLIVSGEQLFIDYNADIKVNTQDYKQQKSLID